MTLHPLQSTTPDFWRLVYDYGCTSIVMLNQLHQSNSAWVRAPLAGQAGCWLPRASVCSRAHPESQRLDSATSLLSGLRWVTLPPRASVSWATKQGCQTGEKQLFFTEYPLCARDSALHLLASEEKMKRREAKPLLLGPSWEVAGL